MPIVDEFQACMLILFYSLKNNVRCEIVICYWRPFLNADVIIFLYSCGCALCSLGKEMSVQQDQADTKHVTGGFPFL